MTLCDIVLRHRGFALSFTKYCPLRVRARQPHLESTPQLHTLTSLPNMKLTRKIGMGSAPKLLPNKLWIRRAKFGIGCHAKSACQMLRRVPMGRLGLNGARARPAIGKYLSSKLGQTLLSLDESLTQAAELK